MSETTLTLGMKFDTAAGKPKTVSLQPCRENLTADEVKAAMDAFIASGVFVYDPTAKLGASIIERTVTTLF
ncbi:MAG: DUF2922 domain-containing protein [Synergistaceae bacterium]|jgi:hypothetical protein|nr:DUF2922 domain-containing protein [Synergistaceae bacterium]